MQSAADRASHRAPASADADARACDPQSARANSTARRRCRLPAALRESPCVRSPRRCCWCRTDGLRVRSRPARHELPSLGPCPRFGPATDRDRLRFTRLPASCDWSVCRSMSAPASRNSQRSQQSFVCVSDWMPSHTIPVMHTNKQIVILQELLPPVPLRASLRLCDFVSIS